MINRFKNIFIKILQSSLFLGLLGIVLFSVFAQQSNEGEILFEVETTPIIQTTAQEISLLIGLANDSKDNRQLILQDIKINKGNKTIKEIFVNQSLFSIKDKLEQIEDLEWEMENAVDESKGREILKQISDLGNEIRKQSFSTSLRVKVADFITSPKPGDQFSITITADLIYNNRTEKTIKEVVISFASSLPSQTNWYVGDGHIHSNHSEWDASYWYRRGRFFVPGPAVNDQSLAAKNFGLEWLIMTDHEEMLNAAEWIEEKQEVDISKSIYGIPVMMGEEVGSVIPKISQGHYLAYGINSYVDASPFFAQDMINKTTEAGGFGFIAHPDNGPFPWKDWDVSGHEGYELLRGEDRQPKAKTIHRWDDQLEINQKPVAIGNSDAHWPEDVGKTRTYLYIEGPITHDSIYNALKNSNTIVTNGPLLTFTINDVVIGETANVSLGEQATLNIQWTSNEDFGPMKEILIISRGGKVLDRLTKDIQTISGSTTISYLISEATYFRLAGESSNGQILYTNPIWVTNYPVEIIGWPMFHHDLERSGYTPEEVRPPLRKIWEFAGGGPSIFEDDFFSSPAIYEGNLYIGSENKKVYGLNASTGQKLWEFTTGAGISFSSPSVAKGIVYIGSRDGKVYAFNSLTGEKIWEFITSKPVFSSPAVVGGVVYIGSDKLYALDAISGQKIWEVRDIYPTGPISISGGIVYTGENARSGVTDSKIYAINAFNGHKIWEFIAGGVVQGAPVISGGVVYIGVMIDSLHGRVYALDAKTGEKKWEFAVNGDILSTPAVKDGVVYIGSGYWDGKLYALNVLNGEKIWEFTLGIGHTIQSSPAISGGVIYFGSGDKKIYAVDGTTGQKLWEFTTGGPVHSSPAVVNGMLYVGSFDGKVYAFGE